VACALLGDPSLKARPRMSHGNNPDCVGSTMGVEYLNGVTMTPCSVKTADQTLSAPVEETQ